MDASVEAGDGVEARDGVEAGAVVAAGDGVATGAFVAEGGVAAAREAGEGAFLDLRLDFEGGASSFGCASVAWKSLVAASAAAWARAVSPLSSIKKRLGMEPRIFPHLVRCFANVRVRTSSARVTPT